MCRPNRFLIIAQITEILNSDGIDPCSEVSLVGQDVACHCPNPGRLLEFVIPGTELLLEHRRASPHADREGRQLPAGLQGTASQPGRGLKTQWTVVAVRYRDNMVPLFSARANSVVEKGVLPVLFPTARHVHSEYTLVNSRFDFMVQDGDGVPHLIEVKACSLVEEGIAMFPDAPSERAVKHIEELVELTKQGYRCHILFVIVHGNAERFIPNLHTDPTFSAALSKAAGSIQVHAVTLKADEQGQGRIINMNVPVDLSFGSLAEANKGSYLIALELPDEIQVEVGSLGTVYFKAGWYVYSGSAQKNLSQRIARHLRHVRKQPHWHLDYLTAHAGKIVGLPIASYENLECELADALKKMGSEPVPRFGSSDCNCESHLFYFSAPPLKNRDFLRVLFYFRYRRSLNLHG